MAPSHPSRRRACATCVKAKVKCQTSTEGSICDRCVRLKIRCTLPSNGCQDADGSFPTRRDRLDCIQQQLDAILAQLSERANPASQLIKSTKSTPPLGAGSFEGDSHPVINPKVPDGLHLRSPLGTPDDDIFTRGLISESEAEKLLDKFRSHNMVLFPFVMIPQMATVSALRQHSPFLLLAVCAACKGDNPQLQKHLNSELADVVAQRIIIRFERNMDLLLGLLVHVAWHHYDWHQVHLQMSMYLQMAITIMADLGLDGETSYTMPAGYSGATRLDKTLLSAAHQESTVAKRAVLGCYYFSSVISIFRRSLAVKQTPRIREYCESLARHPEYPTDSLLHAFVGGQSLARMVEEKLSLNGSFAWDSLSSTIDEECARTKADLAPHGLFVNGASLLEFKAMKAFAGVRYLRYLSKSPGPADSRSIHAVLTSARSTVTAFLELPQTVVANLPISSLVTVWYCLLMVCKLTILSPQGSWTDRDFLGRSQARQFVLAVAEKFGLLSKGDDFWLKATRTMGTLVPWLEERLAGGGAGGGSVVLPHPIDGPRPTIAAQGIAVVESPPEPRSDAVEFPPGVVRYVGDPSGVPAVSFRGLPEGEGGPGNDSVLYWDEQTWQQMVADFAIGPSYSSL